MDSTTLDSVELKDHTWKKCDACGFEYPPIADQCPECHPPPPAAREDRPAVERQPRTPDEATKVMEKCGVNVHWFQHATLESFDPDPDKHALTRAHRWIKSWEDTMRERWPRRDWMYLYGDGSDEDEGDVTIGRLGNGKTHLGIAIARDLIERDLLSPARYLFVTAEALLLEMEATFRSKSEDSEFRVLKKYERVDLLHIDDFGVREPTPHAVRILDELTKRREGKGTIWTSNLSLKVVAKTTPALQRILSRIAGACGEGAQYVTNFKGEDRRVERSKRGRS